MAADEQYIFKPEAKRKISILFGVGILLFVLGVIMAMNSGGHHEEDLHGFHCCTGHQDGRLGLVKTARKKRASKLALSP